MLSLWTLLPLGLVLTVLFSDHESLPSAEVATAEIVKLLRKNSDCELCRELLVSVDYQQHLESFSKKENVSLLGSESKQNSRVCRNGFDKSGCDPAVGDDITKRSTWATEFVHSLREFYAEVDGAMADFIDQRSKDLVEYVLALSQDASRNNSEDIAFINNLLQEQEIPSAPDAAFEKWSQSTYASIQRRDDFCWRHCEGSLSTPEQLRLRILRLYVAKSVRSQLISIQQQRDTVCCLIAVFLFLLHILQSYVVETEKMPGADIYGHSGAPASVTVGNLVTRRATYQRGRAVHMKKEAR
ncbi:hypothetical protein ERJ75_001351300 [Trypanosoma vivax]|uniref:Uncharacterized protein n=1 Tax=Trypanosoma vivax (strain Y486) TaxID=1055687 RepID=G0UCZ1_TRYVY|nr:hypothetical protein ERJ75_001351300 [Trypanosoma vivax]CCC53701.1 conserved hypothetical protein [Trypanosoma vivax Y486]